MRGTFEVVSLYLKVLGNSYKLFIRGTILNLRSSKTLRVVRNRVLMPLLGIRVFRLKEYTSISGIRGISNNYYR